jgi:hypothetical protein
MRHAGGLKKGVSKDRGRKSRKTRGNRQRNGGPALDPIDRNDDERLAEPQIKRRTGRAHPPMTKERSAAPSARPGSLDNVGGGLDAGDIAKLPCRHKRLSRADQINR